MSERDVCEVLERTVKQATPREAHGFPLVTCNADMLTAAAGEIRALRAELAALSERERIEGCVREMPNCEYAVRPCRDHYHVFVFGGESFDLVGGRFNDSYAACHAVRLLHAGHPVDDVLPLLLARELSDERGRQ